MSKRLSPAARARHSGLHLDEQDLLPASGICPICGFEKRITERTVVVQESPDIWFERCERCGGLSASRMPTASCIDRTYENFYVDNEDGHTFHDPDRLAAHIIASIGNHLPNRKLRVLEIGGGDGTLLRCIARRLSIRYPGYEVEADEVEFYDGRDENTDEFSMRFHRQIDSVDGDFDLAIANACLHQIPDLHGVLSPMFRSIRPGGTFFASTAYIEPLSALLGQRVDTLYPLHVHDLGHRFWNSLPDTFGLPARVIRSGASIVETQIRKAPVRSLLAHAVKLPANFERTLRGPVYNPIWTLVGGWEAFVRFDGKSNSQ